MSHVCNHNFSLGVKKLMVLVVCGHEYIGSCTDGLAKEEPPGASADSHIGHRSAPERRMADNLGAQLFLEQREEITFRHGFFQTPQQATSNALVVVLQSVDIICHFLIGVRFE